MKLWMALFPATVTFAIGSAPIESAIAARGEIGYGRTGQSNAGGRAAPCEENVCLPPNNFESDNGTEGGQFRSCEVLREIPSPQNSSTSNSSSSSAGESCGADGAPGNMSKAPGSLRGTSDQDAGQLDKCLNEVRAKLPGSLQEQKKYISQLKSARLKTFLAMAFTTYGEADGNMEEADHHAIQKTVANRTKSCLNGKPAKEKATAWEIAIAPMQFSMYNDAIYGKNGDTFIKNKEKSPERMKKAILAFIKLQCAKFEPPDKWKKVGHYHANYVSPSWAKAGDKVQPAVVNSKPIKAGNPSHIFYSTEWACNIKDDVNLNVAAYDRFGIPSLGSLVAGLARLCFHSEAAWAAGDGFEIAHFTQYGSYLRLKSRPLVQIQVLSDPRGAKLLSARQHPFHKHLEIIEFDSGEHGTSQIVSIRGAAIFNSRTQKFLGEFPLSYTVKGAQPGTQPKQPKWSYDKSSITVFDPETGRNTVIKAN